jgi:hypothetical protein
MIETDALNKKSPKDPRCKPVEDLYEELTNLFLKHVGPNGMTPHEFIGVLAHFQVSIMKSMPNLR